VTSRPEGEIGGTRGHRRLLVRLTGRFRRVPYPLVGGRQASSTLTVRCLAPSARTGRARGRSHAPPRTSRRSSAPTSAARSADDVAGCVSRASRQSGSRPARVDTDVELLGDLSHCEEADAHTLLQLSGYAEQTYEPVLLRTAATTATLRAPPGVRSHSSHFCRAVRGASGDGCASAGCAGRRPTTRSSRRRTRR